MTLRYNLIILAIVSIFLLIFSAFNPTFGYELNDRLSFSGITIPNSIVKIKLKSQTLTTWSKNDGTFTYIPLNNEEVPPKIDVLINNFKDEMIEDQIHSSIPNNDSFYQGINHLNIDFASLCEGLIITKFKPEVDIVVEVVDGKKKQYILGKNFVLDQERFDIPRTFNTNIALNINSMYEGKLQTQSVSLKEDKQCE
ncbi:MAG: hypothetical protein ACRCXZ_03665 [Patescibacteria group bacterium]